MGLSWFYWMQDGYKTAEYAQVDRLLIKLLCVFGEVSIALLILYFAYELVDLGKQYYDRNKRGF